MISVPEAKSVLGIPDLINTEDIHVGQLIAAAVAFMEKRTGRYFGEPQTHTETVVGAGTGTLYLSDTPAALPALTVSEVQYAGDVATVLDVASDDGWVAVGSTLVRRGGGVWTWGYRYSVAYTRGFTSGTAPADVVQAVTSLVVMFYKANRNAGVSITSETISGYSWSGDLSDDMLPGIVKLVIENHWRPVV